jgi:hypothetical protein
MSGIIGSKLNIRGSGLVAKLGTDGQVLTSAGAGKSAVYEDLAGGISWQSVVTGSTMTAVAGNGYPINTTSNTCTITLPASASAGDEIIFTDYARNWGTNKIIIDSNGLNYQGDADTFTVEYSTAGQSLHIIYADATKGWIPIEDDDVTDAPAAPSSNQNGLFGYGDGGGETAVTNIVSNVGVVASDVSGVGTAREELAACGYGNDKAIFGFGRIDSSDSLTGVTNLVNNSGVVASDVSAVGTARRLPAAATYGGDKGIFGFGTTGSYTAVTNLVNSSGVVASDVSGVGTARAYLGACSYSADKDKAIFAYGHDASSVVSVSNLVNNSGVVASDVTGVGTARRKLGACEYGGDKGIFGYGSGLSSVTNLVSNVGVIGTDVSGVGTAREELVACDYGLDKGIFGYGNTGSVSSLTNLVSNVGVVAANVTGVGTARDKLAGTNFN